MQRLSIALLACFVSFSAHAADVKGTWLTEEGKAHVLIESCGAKICGKIIWLKNPNDANGKPLVDSLNENASLKTRPIIGLKLVDMSSADANTWKGKVYNPEDGKTYNGNITLENNASLVVKGCIMGGTLCDDQTWKRLK